MITSQATMSHSWIATVIAGKKWIIVVLKRSEVSLQRLGSSRLRFITGLIGFISGKL
jgi:hypothetical protein